MRSEKKPACKGGMRSASNAKTRSYNKGNTKETIIDLVDYQLSDESNRLLSLS